ncbi:hypothetical protein SporoP37_00510 [Sporosarcina sp. P37]|uniref:hypothetical protein n=1 Tax=unclassified Sporosarcina TaxID=2647733 RepID=UPI000A17E78A|nr:MULTISPECIES: hypothetical protein [unclassified Sporosarcina]ARK23319.1 hypothetical protein SporoP37_00510 [Sporosarcina sp. P37]PID19572.1 hypothetical protein CSV62_03465 [Sporosarcina sp. P35]
MPYNPTKWINTTYDADGEVLQKGTPYNAENMNKIEGQLVELDKLPATVATHGNDLTAQEEHIQQVEERVEAMETSKAKPNGIATLNAEGIIPSSQLPSNLKEIRLVNSIEERDALETFEGLRVMVMLGESWKEYVWNGAEYIKTADSENLNIVLSWGNITEKPTTFIPSAHAHTESDITNLDKYTQEEVNAKLRLKSDADHKHTESDITDLDKYSTAEIDTMMRSKAPANHMHSEFSEITNQERRLAELENSSGQLHTHENKDTLDKLTYSGSKPGIDLVKIEELENHTHDYKDLTNKPTIPTKTSQLSNDSEYVKSNADRIHVSYSDSDIPPLQPNDIVLKVI